MNRILLLLCALMFVGCKEVPGTLTVEKHIKVKKTAYDRCKKYGERPENCTRYDLVTYIKPGVYNATLKAHSDRKYTLEAGKQKLKMKLPKGKSIPRHDGDFTIDPVHTGFEFTIFGNITTNVTYSETVRDWEACNYTEREHVCRRVPVKRCRTNRKGERVCRTHYKRECRWEDVTKRGDQRVEYHYKYTDQYLTLSFDESEDSHLGIFKGETNTREKIYQHKGLCR